MFDRTDFVFMASINPVMVASALLGSYYHVPYGAEIIGILTACVIGVYSCARYGNRATL